MSTENRSSAAADRDGHPTSVHYDNDVAFFRAFLDPYLKYTSGLYHSRADSDDIAMVRMLDRHIELARLPEHGSVLDVGCGWGSLARRLRETRSDVRYTGLTPSDAQAAFVAKELPHAVVVRGTFEQAPLAAPYDAIVMSGALCHIPDKASALRKAESLLAPGGALVIEDTFFLSDALHAKHGAHPKTRYVQREIFGFAEILSLGRHCELAAAAGLKLTEALETSDSYRRTLDAWIGRLGALDQNRFPLAADYVRYMKIAQEGWSYTIVNYVLAMQRARDAR